LSDEHRPQLRRSTPSPRFDATYGQAPSGYARELETGRRCNHPSGGVGGGSQTEVSWWLEGPAAIPANCSPAELARANEVGRRDPEAVLSTVPGACFLRHWGRGDRHGRRH